MDNPCIKSPLLDCSRNESWKRRKNDRLEELQSLEQAENTMSLTKKKESGRSREQIGIMGKMYDGRKEAEAW